jgi:hypothetical protein
VRSRLDEYLDAGATEIIICDVSDVIAAVDAVVAPTSY